MAKKSKHRAKRVWLVDHPLFQYKEDVKELAEQNRLRIVDTKHKNGLNPRIDIIAEDPPKLTKKSKKQLATDESEAAAEAGQTTSGELTEQQAAEQEAAQAAE